MHGWDLWTLEEPRIIEGNRRVATNALRKRLTVYDDGAMVFVGAFEEFLGWPRNPQQFREDPEINSLALIELAYNFTRTYGDVADFLKPRPRHVDLRVSFRDMHLDSGRRVYLEPGLTSHMQRITIRTSETEATASSSDLPPIELALSDNKDEFAAEATYRLLTSIYRWFGLSDDDIPLVNHDTERFETERLRAELAR